MRIQSFDDQKLKKKNTAENFCLPFFDGKLQCTYVQATGPSALKREHPALKKN
jgi:hypothetical protein